MSWVSRGGGFGEMDERHPPMLVGCELWVLGGCGWHGAAASNEDGGTTKPCCIRMPTSEGCLRSKGCGGCGTYPGRGSAAG